MSAAPLSGDVALPSHPEPHTYKWTERELSAIHTYGQQCSDAGFEAGKRLAHEQALLVIHNLMAERDSAIRALKGGK